MKSRPVGKVQIGLVQHKVEPTVEAMLEKTVEAVRELASRGAELILLQELFASPYFCQTEDPAAFALAEARDGLQVSTLAKEAARLKVCLSVPFFERRAPGLFHNSMAILGPEGTELGFYRKMHIPDDPQFMEKFYFTPGDLGYMSVPTPSCKLGPLICWDQWYPEAARLTALRGAELLYYPTAIAWARIMVCQAES